MNKFNKNKDIGFEYGSHAASTNNAFLNAIKTIFSFILSGIKFIFKCIGKLFYGIYYAIKLCFSFLANRLGLRNTIILLVGIVVLCVAAFFVIEGVKSYVAEQQRLEAIRIEEERKEAERKAKEEKEEQERRILASKTDEDKFNAVYGIKTLGLPSKILPVNVISQYPEYPAGCEALAATNALNYYGYNFTKSDIIKKYLPYGSTDFINTYVGNPADYINGGVIMAPGITSVYRKVLAESNPNLYAYNVTGKSLEDLFTYIERGHPVQIWSSINMGSLGSVISTYQGYSFYQYSHSVVLKGFDRQKGLVYFADSISGDVSYSIDRVKTIFNTQKAQAIVVVKKDELNAWLLGRDASYDNTVEMLDQSAKNKEQENNSDENSENRESDDNSENNED